jgi:hypothetical protein
MKVYIAGPYTEGVWEENIRQVVDAAEELWNADHTPFIPHTMTTLWALNYPKKKAEWLDFDFRWLGQCDAMIRLDGDSEGSEREVEFALNNDIDVYYSVESFLENNGN